MDTNATATENLELPPTMQNVLPNELERIERTRFLARLHAQELGFSEAAILEVEIAVRSYFYGAPIEPSGTLAQNVARWFFIEACFENQAWTDLPGQHTRWYAPVRRFTAAIAECQKHARTGGKSRKFTDSQLSLCAAVIRSYCYGPILTVDDPKVTEQARWRFVAACLFNHWKDLPGQRTSWYDSVKAQVEEDIAKSREKATTGK